MHNCGASLIVARIITFKNWILTNVFVVMYLQTKQFQTRVYQLMTYQFWCCIEVLWTSTAKYSFMSQCWTKHSKIRTISEFLLTESTCQTEYLHWVTIRCHLSVYWYCVASKRTYAVSTRVQLHASVNRLMPLQSTADLKLQWRQWYSLLYHWIYCFCRDNDR